MATQTDAIAALEVWYEGLRRYANNLPAKGSISAALVVLERLRDNYDLEISSHVAEGESQIAGLSATNVARILRAHGEDRAISAVGGRSNRGARGDIANLLQKCRTLKLETVPKTKRAQILNAMQRHIVQNYVSVYFNIQRVKAVFEPASATSRFIEQILENARSAGKAGAVAEHLVGGKLALRFPSLDIRNKPFSTADTHGGHEGDFEIGNTTFHVTVAPMPELFVKLRGNLERGMRVYLIVPYDQLAGAKQNAQLAGAGKIEVTAIESFVATNLDEINEFDARKLKTGLLRLLEKYNTRVDAVEHDKSLLIEIPRNLK